MKFQLNKNKLEFKGNWYNTHAHGVAPLAYAHHGYAHAVPAYAHGYAHAAPAHSATYKVCLIFLILLILKFLQFLIKFSNILFPPKK